MSLQFYMHSRKIESHPTHTKRLKTRIMQNCNIVHILIVPTRLHKVSCYNHYIMYACDTSQ